MEYLEESAVTTLFSTLKDKNHEKTVSDYEIRYPTHVNDVAQVLVGLAEKCDSSVSSSVLHFLINLSTLSLYPCGTFRMRSRASTIGVGRRP